MAKAQPILVAEDCVEDAVLLKRAFLKAGLNVPMEFVRDGEEAIEYLSDEGHSGKRHVSPALLLLDLKMPKLDGFDVLSWLKKQNGLHRLLVVVLSSSNEPEDVDRAFDLGANSYLLKPDSFSDLMLLVEKLHSYWLELNQCPSCKPRKR